jgi:hypothetical protein
MYRCEFEQVGTHFLTYGDTIPEFVQLTQHHYVTKKQHPPMKIS